MNNTIADRNPKQCRACDNIKGNKPYGKHMTVYQCSACGALFGQCYLGDSYEMVLPRMTDADVAHEDVRYFDFSTVGSAGLGRRHGWFQISTKLITQVG